MARVRLSGPRGPHPRAGVTTRDYVMVDASLHADFHRRWRAIERRWLTGEGGSFDVLVMQMATVRHERALLRAELRRTASICPGPYLVPV